MGLVQSDLKSDGCEYQDLQSANRISNAYIHCGRIANPPERGKSTNWLKSEAGTNIIDEVLTSQGARHGVRFRLFTKTLKTPLLMS